ncbi:MAG: asparaginase, partial [Acidobacteria bacterium]|nr:asparaginase [Acidobacteriota bacterium]
MRRDKSKRKFERGHTRPNPMEEDNTLQPAPLVEVTRGSITESRHRGHVIAVDGDGQIIAWLGTPETITYLRSSATPLQAIPLVATGAADRFKFTPQE